MRPDWVRAPLPPGSIPGPPLRGLRDAPLDLLWPSHSCAHVYSQPPSLPGQGLVASAVLPQPELIALD